MKISQKYYVEDKVKSVSESSKSSISLQESHYHDRKGMNDELQFNKNLAVDSSSIIDPGLD